MITLADAAMCTAAVIVTVDVIATVIVAALGNGIDAVAVIDAVNERATGCWQTCCGANRVDR